MLWLALLGAQAIFPKHQPYLQDDLNSMRAPKRLRNQRFSIAAVPTPGRLVLDVPGVAKEHGLLRIPAIVIIVVVGALIGIIARDGNGDVTHLL